MQFFKSVVDFYLFQKGEIPDLALTDAVKLFTIHLLDDFSCVVTIEKCVFDGMRRKRCFLFRFNGYGLAPLDFLHGYFPRVITGQLHLQRQQRHEESLPREVQRKGEPAGR